MELKSLTSYALLENVMFLKKNPLFSNIITGELKAVAAITEELSFQFGEEIVKERDPGDSAFIIKEGRVSIVKKTADDRNLNLAELCEGDFFGEMSLLDGEPRSATAVAQSPCTLLRITRDEFTDVIREYPSIAIELIRIFVKRLRAANALIEGGNVPPSERL
jgi:CRP/FNR family transcriptional regulator, cyclic AMP receptor protein